MSYSASKTIIIHSYAIILLKCALVSVVSSTTSISSFLTTKISVTVFIFSIRRFEHLFGTALSGFPHGEENDFVLHLVIFYRRRTDRKFTWVRLTTISTLIALVI